MPPYADETDEAAGLPCADKVAFEAKEQAIGAAAAADWQYGSKLKVYRCRHCQLWHLASRHDD